MPSMLSTATMQSDLTPSGTCAPPLHKAKTEALEPPAEPRTGGERDRRFEGLSCGTFITSSTHWMACRSPPPALGLA
jgi:hypothetical protein